MMRTPQTIRTLWLLWRLCTLRHWVHAPAASLTLTLILALGVAVFFSIRLANRSAVAGFAQFSTTLTGDADVVITSPAGRLSVRLLPELRRRLGNVPAALVPVVQATASLPQSGRAADDFDARQIEAVGIDLIAIQNLRYVRDGAARPSNALIASVDDLALGEPDRVFLPGPLARRHGLESGDVWEVILGDQPRRLVVAGLLQADAQAPAVPDDLLVFDLPALQQLTGTTGWIDRVEVFLPASADPERSLAVVEEALAPASSDPWQLESSGERKASARRMTAAFRANLTILSGLALLVGVYLILQALEAAVVRRRPEIATLLSLGVDAGAIRTAWLLESASFGVIGTLLGLAMGFGGAQLAVQGVARTVNALYLTTDASRASWHSGEALLAFVIGVGASLVAGILPAHDAAATPPAHMLKQGSHHPGIRLLDRPWQGLLLLFAGLILIQLPPVRWDGATRFPLAGYGGAICWLLGASVVVAAVFPLLARVLGPLGGFSPIARLAVSQFRRPSGRHKLTVAGLVVAVSMASGMSILIHSFEQTMEYWIGRTLKADLFVAAKGVQNASNRNRIAPATWRRMTRDPAVSAADITHLHRIELEGAPTFLVGARLGRGWDDEPLIWLRKPAGSLGLSSPDPDGAWPAYISESFHHRYRMAPGDALTLPTPAGPQRVRIAGIFADYGNERGSIMVDPDQVTAWYGDAGAVNVAAYVTPGADVERVRRRWEAAYPGLAVRSNAVLRAEVLRIFRQTFSITYALKFIGICVAIAGLALALISLLLERRRELATLKELGMSSGQISAAVCAEGSAVALVGLAGGLLLSFALGYVLIFVINRQSFGWTLGYAVSWSSTAALGLAVLGAAVATTALVGRWASRLQGDQEE